MIDTIRTSFRTAQPGLESDSGRLQINPNRADAVVLGKLPGVGPVLAGRILEDRVTNGDYQTPEDLLRVKGIGTTILERMRPYLKLP